MDSGIGLAAVPDVGALRFGRTDLRGANGQGVFVPKKGAPIHLSNSDLEHGRDGAAALITSGAKRKKTGCDQAKSCVIQRHGISAGTWMRRKDKGQTVAKLHERDHGSYANPKKDKKDENKWKYTGVCYADQVDSH